MSYGTCRLECDPTDGGSQGACGALRQTHYHQSLTQPSRVPDWREAQLREKRNLTHHQDVLVQQVEDRLPLQNRNRQTQELGKASVLLRTMKDASRLIHGRSEGMVQRLLNPRT